ncbi:MAG: ABC transporter ATP-binding protein [Rickettsia endosymbiont of Ixodes persulcatus]|nr:ABC transporter ATP-binding protein [Rickettsia endosymbiont of Ixodes persulcatus]
MTFIKMNHIHKVYNEKVLAIDDFNLEIEKNEFVALIGPSGCGKSTLLRMIAGLEDITYGDLIIGEKRVNDIHAKDRDISMVFQNYALYPHMTVADNIGFGLKLRKQGKTDIKKKVDEVSEILGLTENLEKTPSELSGGQRQRVALGRAMTQDSNIFLMDEPLSNLDAKLRGKMRMEILKLHRDLGVTTIYVTHDQVEAMTMADKIVVMRGGVIQQIGAPRDLYYNPRNLFVATFIGDPEINLLKVEVGDANLTIENKVYPIPTKNKEVLKAYKGKQVNLGIRPEDIRIENVYLENYKDYCVKKNVKLVEMRGDSSIITTEFANNDFYLKIPSHCDYQIDDQIEFVLNLDKALFFDIETE